MVQIGFLFAIAGKTMMDNARVWELQQTREPRRGSNICRYPIAQPSTQKREQPQFETACPPAACITMKALTMAPRHEMARALDLKRFIEQLSVRADCLKAVVFHHNGLAPQ